MYTSTGTTSTAFVRHAGGGRRVFDMEHAGVFKRRNCVLFSEFKSSFYSAGSVKSFALPFLESGVRIFSAYAANAVPVAQYTAAQIVLANKGFF